MSFTVHIDKGWTSNTSMNLKGLIVRKHIEKYRIDSTTFVAPFTAQQALNLSSFAVYGPDPYARLRNATTDIDDDKRNPWVYRCTVEYSTETPDPDQENREEDNPLDDTPEIDLDGEIIMYPMFRDRNDKLIANTALQPITGVQEERAIEVLTINRNEAVRNSIRDRKYRNTVNKYAWSGAPPGTLKIRSIKATRQYRNQILFWKYNYVIAYNEKGWQPKVLNAGTMQYVPGSGSSIQKVACLDSHNERVTEPVPIDIDGKQIIESALPDAAIYLTFNTLNETDFSQLNLPSS